MFGYVMVNKPELKIKEYNRYKGYYCGLCKVLKERYGRLGQITLTYDMTFLIILLSSLYEVDMKYGEGRCLAHPMQKHPLITNEITEYASDMNIALTYHHLKDDWNDEKSVKGLAGSQVFARKYKKIEKSYPRQCKVIEACLTKLQEYEQQEIKDIDSVSATFGELMAELFIYRKDEWEKDLRKIGFYLGKFIYLMDAYEDLPKDIKQNSYNPLKDMRNLDDYEEKCNQMLVMMMAECSKVFEKLPLMMDVELLRNIIYAGVWARYDKLRQDKRIKGKEQKYDSRSV